MAMSLTTLIILHTGFIRDYINSSNLMKAALVARSAITVLELEDQAPSQGTKRGKVRELLRKLKSNDDIKDQWRKEIEDWTYTRDVSSIAIQENRDALRRIDLVISWGDAEDQSYTLVYFMRPKND